MNGSGSEVILSDLDVHWMELKNVAGRKILLWWGWGHGQIKTTDRVIFGSDIFEVFGVKDMGDGVPLGIEALSVEDEWEDHGP